MVAKAEFAQSYSAHEIASFLYFLKIIILENHLLIVDLPTLYVFEKGFSKDKLGDISPK